MTQPPTLPDTPAADDHQDEELARIREAKLAELRARAAAEGKAVIEVQGEPGARGGLRLWCEEHFQPYRLDRSLNALMAGKLLTDALLSDDAFQLACGRDEAAGKPADSSRIPAEGAKLGAICCYLGSERTQLVYELVGSARERAFLRASDAVIARENAREHPTVRRAPPPEDFMHETPAPGAADDQEELDRGA